MPSSPPPRSPSADTNAHMALPRVVGCVPDHSSHLDYSTQQLPAQTSRSLARAVAHTLRRAITHTGSKKSSGIPSPETSFSSVSTQSTSGTSSGDTPLSSVVSRSNSPTLPQPITTSWSLQTMLALTTKRMTPISPFSPKSISKFDPQLQETVDSLVAEYMQMADLHESGIIDASRVRRGILGLGPKRREKCDLYYEVFGTGTKKLFLIMGMVGCTMYWRLQTRYFAQLGDYTICVFDNCGSGKSTISSGPYKITQLAQDAGLVLERLGWSQDIHLVGVSLGGMIAQEMCLKSDRHFASVAFVDTWHSSTMALPTAKEVRFAFKGMSALGSNPKHLIDLVFSRQWANSEFHDTFKDTVEDNDRRQSRPSNRDVMTALFRAIQVDLNQYRDNLDTQPSEPTAPSELHSVDTTASAIPLPANDADLATCSFDIDELSGTAIHISKSRLRHSRSAGTMTKLSQAAPNQSNSTGTDIKREVSGDLHQFMACLGHTLTPARVKSIRIRNPHTRFLVIHGEKDKVIRPASGRTLAKLLSCPIIWINGSGHMPLIDSHCTFNLVLRAFTRDEKWLHQ
ncbi:hypothetical protein GGI16_003763, partial [Coemansia sp. S142-1]